MPRVLHERKSIKQRFRLGILFYFSLRPSSFYHRTYFKIEEKRETAQFQHRY